MRLLRVGEHDRIVEQRLPSADDAKRCCAAARELVEQAQAAQTARRFDDAVEMATRALEMGRDHGDAFACGGSLAILAAGQVLRGQAEAAYVSACAACELLDGTQDAAWLLKARNVSGLVRLYAGDDHSAVEIWRDALNSPHDESAQTALAVSLRFMITFNIATVLMAHRDYENVVDLLLPSVAQAAKTADQRLNYLRGASVLALAHANYAEVLSRAGRQEESQMQLRCASSMLPALDPFQWRTFSAVELYALWHRVQTLAVLSRFGEARSAAAAAFMIARKSADDLRCYANAAGSVADVYCYGGNTGRAKHYYRRALVTHRALGNQHAVRQAMVSLADAHAQSGEHEQALALRKEMMASAAADQPQRSAMSQRLAVIEREIEAQLADARQKMAHAQQLSVIGRLVGQIHHTLLAPIQRTRQLCLLALRAHESTAARSVSAPGLPALLSAISYSIDEVASLSRQLKIYAYRSSAITTTLSIAAALHEVWSTLRPHLKERARELRVTGDTGLHVRGDPQRLGVLLTLMMIELVKKQPADHRVALVTAVLDSPEPGSVALVMDSEVAVEAPHADPGAMALIESLCKEIAAEMGATLRCMHPSHALLRCILVMPDADTPR